MKITAVKTFLCNCYRTNWVFVKIETDSGIHGWGEATLEYKENTVADRPGTSWTETDRQRQSCWFESCPNERISVCSVAAMPVSSSAECHCAYSQEKYAAGGAQRHS